MIDVIFATLIVIVFFMILIVLCGEFILAAADSKLTAIVIICGIIFSIICFIGGFHLHERKSNVRDRYEQLTGEKPVCKKPDINENHISKNKEITFNVVKVNNEDVAKLTFYDTMSVKRFFDPKHKCSAKECVSNYRKYVQNYLNQYALKLAITKDDCHSLIVF